MHSFPRRFSTSFVALAAMAALPHATAADRMVGLTADNRLISFDSTSPGLLFSNVAITGVQAGETILGIDMRPSNGLLYGLGSSNRVYSFDVASGAATSSVMLSGATLSGNSFGVDFNPVADTAGLSSLRVVSNLDQNLRINVATGVITVDAVLKAGPPPNFPINPTIGGSAYSNNVFGATFTTLYNIDYNFDRLAIQSPPIEGRLTRVGELLPTGTPPVGGDITSDLVGFDISGPSDIAYASLTTPGSAGSRLFEIDLATGAAKLIGGIGENQVLRGLAVINVVPAPETTFLVGIGLLALVWQGKRRQEA